MIPKPVKKSFDEFEQFVHDNVKDKTILPDSSAMYNAEESGFALNAKTGYVPVLRGAKSL